MSCIKYITTAKKQPRSVEELRQDVEYLQNMKDEDDKYDAADYDPVLGKALN